MPDYCPGNFAGIQRCSSWSILVGKPTLTPLFYFFFSFMAAKGGQLVAGSGVEAGTTPSSPPFYSLIVFSQRNKSQKGDGSDNLGIR